MRILTGILIIGTLAFSGCGAPEPKFATTEDMATLVPAAQNVAKASVKDHFGSPAKMVAWQRLPVAFGGVPGKVVDVVYDTEEKHQHLITALKVDFQGPALLVTYDVNLDGQLSKAEFPLELQKELAGAGWTKADKNSDGFLTPEEFPRSNGFKKFYKKTISGVTDESAKDLIGKELLFANGSYSKQQVKIQAIKPAESGKDNSLTKTGVGLVEIWPPLNSKPVSDEQNSSEPVIDEVVVDYGHHMRTGRELYMRHCMHCHGVTGDGNGPTAKYLNPLPRDYRLGIFKFTSVKRIQAGHASREDLTRILKNGIPGTYMPSFAMLKEDEAADIIEYVRWLTMRGEYERKMISVFTDYEYSTQDVEKKVTQKWDKYQADVKAGKKPEEQTKDSIRQEIDADLTKFIDTKFAKAADEATDFYVNRWREAEWYENVVYPKEPRTPNTVESRSRGRALFLAKCIACHGVTGEGDGENTTKYQLNTVTKKEYAKPGFHDAWGHAIKPRNLNTGIYRGGRRPLDIYRRISQGIPGTPMDPLGENFANDQEIWDVVNYVLSIPIDGPLGPTITEKPGPADKSKTVEPSAH